jgi:hypothetical protein
MVRVTHGCNPRRERLHGFKRLKEKKWEQETGKAHMVQK